MLNITAHGNLGKDPELKEFNDRQVANFSIAARTGKDETTWINCQVWGKRADTVMQYMHKGDKITVCGQGKLQEYERKSDGGKGYSLQLNVSDFTLPARKAESDDEF
tara:strand:+ start:423 stop:743 length:321 start_codon:yes stop_codon:yes gene_type:complete